MTARLSSVKKSSLAPSSVENVKTSINDISTTTKNIQTIPTDICIIW